MHFEYRLPKVGSKIGYSDLIMAMKPKIFKPDIEYIVVKAKQYLDGGIRITVEDGTQFYNGEYRIL